MTQLTVATSIALTTLKAAEALLGKRRLAQPAAEGIGRVAANKRATVLRSSAGKLGKAFDPHQPRDEKGMWAVTLRGKNVLAGAHEPARQFTVFDPIGQTKKIAERNAASHAFANHGMRHPNKEDLPEVVRSKFMSHKAINATYGKPHLRTDDTVQRRAKVLKRAYAVLAKAGFDPSQERDAHGRWSAGGGFGTQALRGLGHPSMTVWGAEHGAGGGTNTHGYAYGTPASDKKWEHLTRDERNERIGELWLQQDNLARNDPDPEIRERSKRRLARWQELRGNRHALEQSVGNYHDARLTARMSNTAVVQAKTEAERLAAATLPQTQVGSPYSSQNSSLSLFDKPPQGLRSTVADASHRAAEVARGVTAVMDAVTSYHEPSSTSTMARMASVAGALTTMAVAFNIASRAANVATVVTAVGSAAKATQILRREVPHIASSVASVDHRAHINSIANRAMGALGGLERQLTQTKVGGKAVQTAARTAFRATGGKIVPASGGTRLPTLLPSRAPRIPNSGARSTSITMHPYKYPSR